MIQSSHNFAHATTAGLSWHVQNGDMIGSLDSALDQIEFRQYFNYELIKPLLNDPADSHSPAVHTPHLQSFHSKRDPFLCAAVFAHIGGPGWGLDL